MTDFKRHDSTAYADDQPLDTFLLVRNNDNFEAVREKRGRLGVWAPGTLDSSSGSVLKAQVSGYETRSMIPYLWHLTEGTTQVSVAVRHRVTTNVAASGSEVTLSAFACSLELFLSGASLPDGTTSGLTGGATSSTTTTINLDVSDLSAGWIVVVVGVLSGEANAVQIVGSGGVTGPQVYTGFYPGMHICNHQATTLGTTGSVINHWGLLVKNATTAKENDVVPRRQLLVLEYDPTIDNDYTYRLHCYPPIGIYESDAITSLQIHETTDGLHYVELGVIDIESVTVYDSAVRARELSGRLDAGLPARAPALIEEVRAQNEWWLTTGRIHHLGPSQSPSDVDFTSTGPANRISGSRFLSASFQEVAACVCGSDDLFEQDGTNYQRTSIQVKALVALTHTTDDTSGDGSVFRLDWRLSLSALSGGGTVVTQTRTTRNVQAMPCPTWAYKPASFPANQEGQGNRSLLRYSSFGYLLGFGPNYGSFSALKRHALRGVLPESEIGRRAIYEVELEIRGTQTGSRRLALECKSSLIRDGGYRRPTRAFPRLHLLTWTVISTPFLDEPAPLTIGAT